MENNSNINQESSWGGARPNSGRPAGGTNIASRTKAQAERELKQRIVENSQRILDKQLSLAEGVQYLMVIRTEVGDNGKKHKCKPEVVTDELTIREYLDGKLNQGGDDEYYFITTERPDTRVLDSLLDRAFGRATNNVDLTSKGQSLSNIKFVFEEDGGEEDKDQPETEAGSPDTN
jgi:hypothetical protein